jgi:hypothetical protein
MRNAFHTGFNPPGMCYDPITATLLIASVVGAGSQIYQGYSAQQQAKRTAGLQEEQARIALSEANRAADQKTVEQRKFLAEQRMAYLASGVSLSGTPGLVQEDTFSQFQQEIEALRKSGVAQFKVGMVTAQNTKANGRAQLISGFLNAGSTLASGASKVGGGGGKVGTTSTDAAIRNTGFIEGRQ